MHQARQPRELRDDSSALRGTDAENGTTDAAAQDRWGSRWNRGFPWPGHAADGGLAVSSLA